MNRRQFINRLFTAVFAGLFVLAIHPEARGGITGVTEAGLGGDTPAIIEQNFNEDSLTFSDRTHQHNGAAFDGAGNASGGVSPSAARNTSDAGGP